MSTKNDILFIPVNEFDKDIIAQSNDYIFVFYDHIDKKNIIKNINRWKNKYSNFGLILSSKGMLIDCTQYDFEIKSKTNLFDDFYYQSIANGIIAIKDEYINNYI